MIIIPAIDLIDGKCVRLTQGDYKQVQVYHDDPVEVALQFADYGIQRLHLVDLDGARAGALKNLRILERVARATSLSIDFGGGVNSMQDVASIFNAGAAMVTVGSIAVKRPALLEEWLMEFGASRFMVGADVMDKQIRISGWTESTQETIFDFIGKLLGLGVTQVFCTDISKDGALAGPAWELYREILEYHPEMHLIASGGVSKLTDLDMLQQVGCAGAIVGKAIYENKFTLRELQQWMEQHQTN